LNNYKTDIINEDNLEVKIDKYYNELIKLKENCNNICNYIKKFKRFKKYRKLVEILIYILLLILESCHRRYLVKK
jgi:hypothetical protein